KEDSSPFTGEVVFDFENEQSSMEFDEMDSAFYQDQDDFFIEYDDGTVLDSESIADADNEGMGENTNKGMELIGNPLEVMKRGMRIFSISLMLRQMMMSNMS